VGKGESQPKGVSNGRASSKKGAFANVFEGGEQRIALPEEKQKGKKKGGGGG